MNNEFDSLIHKTIKKVSEDIEAFKFNTAISSLMILLNELEKQQEINQTHYSLFIILLSPFAPHLADELWQAQGYEGLVLSQSWPKFDEEKIKDATVKVVVQVNGKVRETFTVPVGTTQQEVKRMAEASEQVQKWVGGKEIIKEIFVPDKLLSLVIKN